jgi:quercetin dioxygenase-like cupin family protein
MPLLRLIVLTGLLVGCAADRRLLLPDPPRHTTVGALLDAHPLPAGQNIQPAEVARGEQSSLSLIQIRDREAPHVHTRYDLTVLLVHGHGVLWLAGVPQAMRTGDVAFVPRGTPHFFITEGDEPAAALVSFAPAFSGPDSQPTAAP